MIQEAVREVQGTIAHVFKRKSLSHSVDKNTKKIISQEFNILTHINKIKNKNRRVRGAQNFRTCVRLPSTFSFRFF